MMHKDGLSSSRSSWTQYSKAWQETSWAQQHVRVWGVTKGD
jgi:hypothetical protein